MNLINLLEAKESTRERKNKNKVIAYVLSKEFQIDLPLDKLESVVKRVNTLDREWRKLLQDNPELRGKDYADKKILEQEKELELGYIPGHEQDVKKLKQVGHIEMRDGNPVYVID
jgi:hypothetical protein